VWRKWDFLSNVAERRQFAVEGPATLARHKGESMPQASITAADIEHFRRRAQVCRAEAELTREPGRWQERLETARAYERMAERAKRRLGLTE